MQSRRQSDSMETIDYHKHKNPFVKDALCTLVGNKYKEIDIEACKAVFNIELKINGVEVSLVDLLEGIDANLDKCITVAAYKMIEEKFGKLEGVVSSLMDHVMQIARTELNIEE